MNKNFVKKELDMKLSEDNVIIWKIVSFWKRFMVNKTLKKYKLETTIHALF